MASNQLIQYEKDALERYQEAISQNIDDRGIIERIGQSSEFLFKAICVKALKEPSTSPAIDEPVQFLETRNFFRARIPYQAQVFNKKTQKYEFEIKYRNKFRTSKHGIIYEDSQVIRIKSNAIKHTSYVVTEEDVQGALMAIKSIMKWYFGERYNYKYIKLSIGHKELLDTLFLSPYIEAKKKYFDYLEKVCGEINFEGIPTYGYKSYKKIKLEDIFIPIHLVEQQQNTEDRKTIGEVLSNTNCMAILAKPGEGKSILIKSIAVAYAFPEKRNSIDEKLPDNPWLPIFIRCRELREKVSLSIFDIINDICRKAEIQSYSTEFNILISESLETGNALLLIDGLDEITDDKKRVQFINQLNIFLERFPNNKVIVTSRITDINESAGSFISFCTTYEISPLINNEIEQLINKWYKIVIDDPQNAIIEAKKATKRIINNSQITILVKNPLLLTTLLFVRKATGNLPTKKSVLYREVLKLLLETWNIEHDKLEIDQTEAQLAYVAYWMTEADKQTITESDLKQCLYSARKQISEILISSNISVGDFIKRVELKSGLLTMTGYEQLESGEISPVYEFIHLSFQEYLSAIAIVKKFLPKEHSEKKPFEILRPYIGKPIWDDIHIFTAMLSKDYCKNMFEHIMLVSSKITEKERKTIVYIYNTKRDDLDRSEMKKILGLKEDDDEEYKNRRKIIANHHDSVMLLRKFFEHEVEFDINLLDNIIDIYIKNYLYFEHDRFLRTVLTNDIFEGKFYESFKRRVMFLIFDEFEDEFLEVLGKIVFIISNHEEIIIKTNKKKNIDDVFKSIKRQITEDDKEAKFFGILRLMIIPFFSMLDKNNFLPDEIVLELSERFDNKNVTKENIEKQIDEIYELLEQTKSFENPYYYFAISISIIQMAEFSSISTALKKKHIKFFLNGISHHSQNGLLKIYLKVLDIYNNHNDLDFALLPKN